MPTDILIHMVVPIRSQDTPGGLGSMTFGSWLPMEEDRLVVRREGMEISIWFDRSCVAILGNKEEIDFSKIVNVVAREAIVDLRIKEVDDDLVTAIAKMAKGDRDQVDPVVQRYESLGKDAYQFVVRTLNRLNSYFRSEKFQFWLDDYDESPERMQSFYVRSQAQYSVDGKRWDLWRPTKTEFVTTLLPSADTYITKEDWKKAAAFVQSNKRRASLEFELMVTAYSHAWGERRRSALIDAVSALEVALSEFARSPKAKEAFGESQAFRIDADSLKSQFEKLGLRGTVRYLLPVIFSEEKVSSDLIKQCQQAVDERNNVAHSGKTNLSRDIVFKHINAVSGLCRILKEYTADKPDERVKW